MWRRAPANTEAISGELKLCPFSISFEVLKFLVLLGLQKIRDKVVIAGAQLALTAIVTPD
jgi:hypothetical protein